MNILNLLKEYNSNKKYYIEKDDAMQEFVKQKQAIDGIINTKGFKEIKLYWQRVVLACNERLRTIQGSDIKRVQWELDIAMQFLDFLTNISLEELDKEDLDILNSN